MAAFDAAGITYTFSCFEAQAKMHHDVVLWASRHLHPSENTPYCHKVEFPSAVDKILTFGHSRIAIDSPSDPLSVSVRN